MARARREKEKEILPLIDFSIYDLALTTEPSPQPLSISPPTLLSLIGSVIDLLIEQQISATLWVKLPPGIWRSEIQRYRSCVGMPHTIYTFNQKPQNPTTTNSQDQEPQTGSELGTDSCPVFSIDLAPTSLLKREYFLLVSSPQFCSLILAHRPSIGKQAGAREKDVEQKMPRLLAICSFEQRVIQQVLDGIRQAIVLSQSQLTPPTTKELEWDCVLNCPAAPDSVLLGQLLVKQIHCQEQIWRSDTTNRAAAALQLQNQALLNTLRLKDEFLSNLCQELRTPLTNMKTALSLLNSPQLKPAGRQRYLQMLNTECDRQNSLITGFLDLVRLDQVAEQTPLQSVRLSDIVPGVVSTYQPLAQEKGIMLAYTVPEELPPVSCLSVWLKQIVINLLHNSIKFTPTGGQVWVISRLQGDYVQLEFRDTGIGIATNEIPKIFDRFYRVRLVASEDVCGAGLGLTMVQQLPLRCSGSISVKSKLGKGSVFNVLLPIVPSTPEDSLS